MTTDLTDLIAASDAVGEERLGKVAKTRKAKREAAEAAKGQPRAGSKEAAMIAMLRQGATVDEMAEAFGWQKHTVRGAMAGAIKKKRGLTITSAKTEDGRRVYRIEGEE